LFALASLTQRWSYLLHHTGNNSCFISRHAGWESRQKQRLQDSNSVPYRFWFALLRLDVPFDVRKGFGGWRNHNYNHRDAER
jgi:hypothetical protein